MGIFGVKQKLVLGLMLTGFVSCSQSRNPITSGGNMSEVQSFFCVDPDTQVEEECLRLRLDYGQNKAYLQAVYLPYQYNGQDIPYRVLGRHKDSQKWDVLKDYVYDGQQYELTPRNGTFIEEYVDWVVETMENENQTQTAWVGVAEFDGIQILDQTIVWQQLPDQYRSTSRGFDPFAQ